MIYWLLPLILLAVSVITIVFLAIRHYNEVSAVDVSTDPKRAKRDLKTELFMKRISRMGGTRTKTATKTASKLSRGAKGVVKGLYKRAQALERHYKRLQKESAKGVAGTREVRESLRKEAEELIAKESYTAAEQRLIELLSLDQKNSEVYEVLGNLYVKMRQWDQARQTFQYAHALVPEDASIVTSLGELALRDGNTAEAVAFFNTAVDMKPNNPKYLDFLIDSSILSGDRKSALKGLKLLKKSNPDNKKIPEFEDRVYSMPLA